MLGIHALQASLELILEQGVSSIQQQVLGLTECIIDEVDRLGFALISPRAEHRRGGIVTFRVPDADNQRLHNDLMNHQVICAYRAGGIRFSPHFYNNPVEIRQAFARLCRQL
jgi:selenocysteine lyase/cysteine desulfurase